MEQGTPMEQVMRPQSTNTSQHSLADLAAPHLDALYGYCVRLSRHGADAEDLLQETLLRAIRSHTTLRDVAKVRAWLFTIATNAWRDRQRAQAREVNAVSLDATDGDDEFSLFATLAIEDPFPYSDELHLDFLRLFRDDEVKGIFSEITPVHRLPLILTTIHGFSCKEAAAILDIPLGTLLSRLHRGRKQLERGLWDYAVRRGLVKAGEEDD